MSEQEINAVLAEAKAEREMADNAWDELVRQARGTET
jgi:hypothetical protein